MKVRVFTVLLNVYFHDFDRIFQDLIYITLRSTSNFNYNLVHYGIGKPCEHCQFIDNYSDKY